MLRVSLLGRKAFGLCGFSLAAVLMGSPVQAADIEFDDPPPSARRYDPPPYRAPEYVPPPVVRREVERYDGPCRIVHRRSIDPYGREVVRRIRECEEGVVAWGPRVAPRYDDRPRVYDTPRPPRSVGPDYRDYREYREPGYRDRQDYDDDPD